MTNPKADIKRDNKQRANRNRMEYAEEQLTLLGFDVEILGDKEIRFQYKGNMIKLFPFTGWFTGKGIKDGRGIKNLIKQIS